MAMSVTYTTFNGQIVYENRGGVESYYAPDTLGSTAALLNASGVVTDTFTYQPYGEIASHVGSSVTPFTYCGTLGYYTDTANSSIYVRARYYRPNLARWQTVDPLWPEQKPYAYAYSSPCSFVDPTGRDGEGILNFIGYTEWYYCKACSSAVNGICTFVGNAYNFIGKEFRIKPLPSPWQPSQPCPKTTACQSMCAEKGFVPFPKQAFSADCAQCCKDSISFEGNPLAYEHAIKACVAACVAIGSGAASGVPPCKCP